MISVLLLLLFTAAWQDLRSYHIRNMLVIPGALLGAVLNILLPAGVGAFESLAGWGAGLLLLLPFYVLRSVAAGDVKLMAMVGAFLGPQVMIGLLLYVLLTGGVLALGLAWYRGVLSGLVFNIKMWLLDRVAVPPAAGSKYSPTKFSLYEAIPKATGKMPYGVAIAIGTAIFLLVHGY